MKYFIFVISIFLLIGTPMQSQIFGKKSETTSLAQPKGGFAKAKQKKSKRKGQAQSSNTQSVSPPQNTKKKKQHQATGGVSKSAIKKKKTHKSVARSAPTAPPISEKQKRAKSIPQGGVSKSAVKEKKTAQGVARSAPTAPPISEKQKKAKTAQGGISKSTIKKATHQGVARSAPAVTPLDEADKQPTNHAKGGFSKSSLKTEKRQSIARSQETQQVIEIAQPERRKTKNNFKANNKPAVKRNPKARTGVPLEKKQPKKPATYDRPNDRRLASKTRKTARREYPGILDNAAYLALSPITQMIAVEHNFKPEYFRYSYMITGAYGLHHAAFGEINQILRCHITMINRNTWTHHLEASVGASFLYSPNAYTYNQLIPLPVPQVEIINGLNLYPSAYFGYRYQKPEDNVVLRVGIGYPELFALSLGIAF